VIARTVTVARRTVAPIALSVSLILLGGLRPSVPQPIGAEPPVSAEQRARQTAGTSATDQVIARWTQRVTIEAHDHDAWTQLGEAFMQKARETADASYYRRAEGAFQRALSVQPQHVAALTGMAWVYGALHEFEESVAWARKALAVDPTHQAAYGLLGDAAVERGDYDAAFEHYQKMLDIRPDLGSPSRGAHLLYLTGNHQKAIRMMEKAIAAGAPNAENTAWARAQLAILLWNTGALLPAERVLETALGAAPGNHQVLAATGRVKAARKEYQAAIDYYRRAIAVAPQHDTVVALGDLYLLTGRKEEAEKQYALVEVIYRLNRANGVRGDLFSR
jgi:tetratricopeptide (TPR) repeat protein